MWWEATRRNYAVSWVEGCFQTKEHGDLGKLGPYSSTCRIKMWLIYHDRVETRRDSHVIFLRGIILVKSLSAMITNLSSFVIFTRVPIASIVNLHNHRFGPVLPIFHTCLIAGRGPNKTWSSGIVRGRWNHSERRLIKRNTTVFRFRCVHILPTPDDYNENTSLSSPVREIG